MNRLKVKERLITDLALLVDPKSKTINPDAKENAGPMLYSIFAWQEIERYAKERVKRAWEGAQSKDGIIPSDEELRELPTKEERIVAETNSFSCLVKIGEPQNRFDKDLFLDEVARRYKIKREKLEEIAEGCVKPTNASITKRVIEV
jgi:hypothetical protein